jgi:hypothetical protein
MYVRVREIPLSPTFFSDLLMTAHKVSCHQREKTQTNLHLHTRTPPTPTTTHPPTHLHSSHARSKRIVFFILHNNLFLQSEELLIQHQILLLKMPLNLV